MLHRITQLSDPLIELLRDDPVRPEIPAEFRVNANSEIFVLLDDRSLPQAVVCVRYRDTVPRSVLELSHPNLMSANTAVFYTIWSYSPGSARRLITAVRSWIHEHRPEISEYVTLSPPTDMAERFHLGNGARVLARNPDTVNYIYT